MFMDSCKIFPAVEAAERMSDTIQAPYWKSRLCNSFMLEVSIAEMYEMNKDCPMRPFCLTVFQSHLTRAVWLVPLT